MARPERRRPGGEERGGEQELPGGSGVNIVPSRRGAGRVGEAGGRALRAKRGKIRPGAQIPPKEPRVHMKADGQSTREIRVPRRQGASGGSDRGSQEAKAQGRGGGEPTYGGRVRVNCDMDHDQAARWRGGEGEPQERHAQHRPADANETERST